jgi:hypothetical protein
MSGYRWETHGVPFVKKKGSWEIDIYAGPSPLALAPAAGARNPVLTANHVTDVKAYFVADPFMLREGGIWYMFFEVLNRASQRGEIAYATSEDGLRWRYQRVVLAEPFHLSFPYVFHWEGEYFMVPESFQAGTVRLYRAVAFPTGWRFDRELCAAAPFVDPCPFHHDGRWWMFVSVPTNDQLRLFNADSLHGPWSEHPRSPVLSGDTRIIRPAGRVIHVNGRPVRFAQDCGSAYGERVRAFEIVELTPTAYREELVCEEPISRPDLRRPRRIHHIDPHQRGDGTWIACGDSFRDGIVFGRRY